MNLSEVIAQYGGRRKSLGVGEKVLTAESTPTGWGIVLGHIVNKRMGYGIVEQYRMYYGDGRERRLKRPARNKVLLRQLERPIIDRLQEQAAQMEAIAAQARLWAGELERIGV